MCSDVPTHQPASKGLLGVEVQQLTPGPPNPERGTRTFQEGRTQSWELAVLVGSVILSMAKLSPSGSTLVARSARSARPWRAGFQQCRRRE